MSGGLLSSNHPLQLPSAIICIDKKDVYLIVIALFTVNPTARRNSASIDSAIYVLVTIPRYLVTFPLNFQ